LHRRFDHLRPDPKIPRGFNREERRQLVCRAAKLGRASVFVAKFGQQMASKGVLQHVQRHVPILPRLTIFGFACRIGPEPVKMDTFLWLTNLLASSSPPEKVPA
jgi:hypothetical protein